MATHRSPTRARWRQLLLLPEPSDPSLSRWRASILRCVLLATLILGTLTMAAQALFSVEDRLQVLVADLLALAAVVVLTFMPGLPYVWRAWSFIALIYVFWLWFFTLLGPVSQIFLLAAPVGAALLLGLRAGLIMVVVSCLSMFVMGMAYYPDATLGTAEGMSAAAVWLMYVLNFGFVSLLLTAAGGILLNRLELALKLSERSQRAINLQDKLQAVGTLASGVAHDFNNVLTIIMSLTETLRQRRDMPADSQQSLKQILLSGERGRSIIQQLMTFSRQSVAERRVLDLTATVLSMQPLLQAQVPAGITLHIHGDQALPVSASETELQQVLMNMISNAVLAVKNQPQARIDILMQPHGDVAELSIQDNGVGIDPAHLPRLFEPFFTTRTTGEGTGLGLASCHGIIKSLGGDIVVVSTVGQGSRFTIHLPMIEATLDPAVTEGSVAAPEDINPEPVGPLHVLMVDDEEMILFTARALLQNAGFCVSAVGSATAALAMLTAADSTIDLMITDYSMPDMNGLQLIHAARQHRPALPVILSSGLGQVDKSAIDAVQNAVLLPKPYRRDELLAAISVVLLKPAV